uniref:Fibronectin type-III domain-containing protein n=2 Tax=Ciona intestinalis TaxID=7719 RepID=H2XW70_CIOIN
MTTANVNLPAFQSTVVSGLLPATSYYVQITAGARGPLFPTAVFEINVANITYQTADTVPLAPSNLNVTSSDQDTVRIEWTRPNETSIGKTIEYTVEAQRSVQDCITFGVPALGFQVDCALPKDFTVSASAVMSNTYVLTGLVPYRTYNIRIRAKTSAGSGPWSNNATAFTGIECPGFRRPVPASQPSCTFQEASIRSENFPRQYPPWNDTFYSVDFRGQGAVQIVF